ncbi:MAG: hypothetical protein IPM66_08830 [Acidobacteriota bacterium]|nr:MAG: hypothetical protein IPM66_08830 [Acidobacteriota bacterium]
MSRIENELRSALRREEPSTDFADRVMARINSLPAKTTPREKREKIDWRSKIIGIFEPFQLKWAMAAAMTILILFAGLSLYRHRENQRLQAEIAEGERARQQVLLAMKLTSEKLNYAHRKVQQSVESRK